MNETFRCLDDLNVANATPLLRRDVNSSYFSSTVSRKLYDSPFLLDGRRKPYGTQVLQNRSRFADAFCRDRLELIFGRPGLLRFVQSSSNEDDVVGCKLAKTSFLKAAMRRTFPGTTQPGLYSTPSVRSTHVKEPRVW
jgi:hypothetical protein